MCREHACCRTAVTVGLNKPKPRNQTGKENKSHSTVPGISRPSNLGMKVEPIRSILSAMICNSKASRVAIYRWLAACSLEMEPFKGHPSTRGRLTGLRNKPQ